MGENREHLGTDDEDQPASELSALVELREFLADELIDIEDKQKFKRAFLPLTDGLGLESPKKKEVSVPPLLPPKKEAIFEAPLSKEDSRSFLFLSQQEEEKTPVTRVHSSNSLTSVMEATQELDVPVPAEVSTKMPPPVPHPSFFRRALAGVIDEIFVLTLWLFAILLTLRIQAGSALTLTVRELAVMNNPVFIRFAIFEFAALWISYFAVCVGVLDMTFGMWVWGIRVSYGLRGIGDSRFVKKVLRILWSFFFYAPIAPLLLLSLKRKGRNLLDLLSGTSLYRSHA